MQNGANILDIPRVFTNQRSTCHFHSNAVRSILVHDQPAFETQRQIRCVLFAAAIHGPGGTLRHNASAPQWREHVVEIIGKSTTREGHIHVVDFGNAM